MCHRCDELACVVSSLQARVDLAEYALDVIAGCYPGDFADRDELLQWQQRVAYAGLTDDRDGLAEAIRDRDGLLALPW